MQPFIYPLHSKKFLNTSYKMLIEHSEAAERNVTELMKLESPYSLVYMHCSPADPETFLRMLLLCPGTHQTFVLQAGDDAVSFFLNRPQHQHDFTEIMYVIKGVVKQHIEKGCFPYSAGQCCFINRNTKHVEEYTTDYEAVFLGMSDDFLMNMIRGDILYEGDVVAHKYNCDIYRSISESQLDKNYNEKKYIDYVPVTEASAGELTELMDMIILECINQRPGASFITLGLCSRFISILEEADKFHKNIICPDTRTDDFLFIRIQLILEKNNGRIRREALAHELHYSSDYLNRIVKTHTGMSLVEYGLTICLKKAKWLLLNTETTVSDIIHLLGFSNRSYFYRIFEKTFGVSPSRIREEE